MRLGRGNVLCEKVKRVNEVKPDVEKVNNLGLRSARDDVRKAEFPVVLPNLSGGWRNYGKHSAKRKRQIKPTVRKDSGRRFGGWRLSFSR